MAASRPWAHNLSTVIAFEVRRTLTRRSFWVLTLAVPLLMIAIGSLVLFSNGEAIRSTDPGQSPAVTFTYTDASGLVDPAVAGAAGGSPTTDAAAARQAVIDGRADLFVAYPADPGKQAIELTGRDRGLTRNGDYTAIARSVLIDSVRGKVQDARVASILESDLGLHLLTYTGGKVAPGIASAILPGAFLVVFYLAIVMLGNQMLNITVEEKENRVTEMILTTIHPTTLIVGKLIALVVVGVVQAIVLVGPLMVMPTLFASLLPTAAAGRSTGGLAGIPTAADIVAAVNVPAIAIGGVLFLGSFLLFTGLLVSVGAIMPTAKDAGSAFGGIVLTLFLPFYAIGMVTSDPHGVPSQILTFFPLTAPITALLRNALGLLTPWETAVAILVIYASAGGLLALGIRLFRTGSISYHARLDVRKVLGFKRPFA